MRTLHCWFLVGLVLSSLAGCGGKALQVSTPPPPPPPTQLELEVSAAKGMNPSATSQGAPLLVRIYELAAKGRLMEADLSRLLADDRTELGADLLSREEARFVPGEQRQIKKTLNPGTRQLAVLAAYRVTDGVTWRAVVPITPETVNRIRLSLGPRELRLSPAH